MPNQLTKYTGNVTGQVGSLITALDAALVTGQGWGKAFSGTNKAAYRAASGSRMYFRVQDDAPVTAKEARITGYESMSDVDTGANPFPTAAQNPVGNSVACMIARKSASADGTNRAYQIFADARTAYVFIATGDAVTYLAFMFGEIYSLVNSDAWNCMIVGRRAENSATGSNDSLDICGAAINSSSSGHYFPRAYTGLPTTNGSLLVGVHGDAAKNNAAAGLVGAVVYPNSPDGGLYLAPVWVHEIAGPYIRGRMRGFWHVCHAVAGFNDGDTFSGVGDLSGKTFQILKTTGNSGLYCIETSATLETN